MNALRTRKQKLAAVSRHWDGQDFDAALAEVEALLERWPGNGHLHILWASLVQLQEEPRHSLDEAKQALRRAVELDESSPAAAIELGHFLDAVEDDPRAAAKAYADGVSLARRLLVEGLIGQAKALLQLGKHDEAFRCLREVLQTMPSEGAGQQDRSAGLSAEQVKEMLSEALNGRSAS